MKPLRIVAIAVTIVMAIALTHLAPVRAQITGVNLLLNGANIFEENDGIKALSTVEINDFTGGLITAEKGLTLFFPDQRSFRWENSVAELTATGTAVVNGRMAASVPITYNKNMRYVSIPVLQNFAAGEYVILTGLKLRIYDRQVGSQPVHLDYTGDGTEDVTVSAGIKVVVMDPAQPTLKRSDRLAPYAVTGLTATPSTTENTIRLNWDSPVDPDASAFTIARYLVASDLTEAIDHGWIVNDGTAATETTDITPVKEKTYRYTVTVSDGINTGPEATVTIAYAVPVPTTTEAPTTAAPETTAEPATTESPTTEAPPATTAKKPGLPERPIEELFTDVPESHWAATAIATLANKGVVGGKANKIYDMNAEATRAEFAKMIVLALKLPVILASSEDPFPDVPKAEWYAPYLGMAKSRGLIKGDNGNAFPARPITRSEVVVVMIRALDLESTLDDSTPTETPFADVAESTWYYKAVYKAKELGLVNGTDATHFAPGKNINRAELAVLINRMVTHIAEATSENPE